MTFLKQLKEDLAKLLHKAVRELIVVRTPKRVVEIELKERVRERVIERESECEWKSVRERKKREKDIGTE